MHRGHELECLETTTGQPMRRSNANSYVTVPLQKPTEKDLLGTCGTADCYTACREKIANEMQEPWEIITATEEI